MSADLEVRVRRWLDDRDPGDAPAALRSAVDLVPESVQFDRRTSLQAALERAGAGPAARWWVLAAAIALLLVALALLGSGALLRRLDRTPPFPPSGLIAYTMDGDLRVVAADGSGADILTDTPEPEFFPSWSPDGRALLFVRGHGDVLPDACVSTSSSSLVTLDVASRTERVLLTRAGFIYLPTWSPDGARIAFMEVPGTCQPGVPPVVSSEVVDVASLAVSPIPAGEGAKWMTWTASSIRYTWDDHVGAVDPNGNTNAVHGVVPYSSGWAVTSPDGAYLALSRAPQDITGRLQIQSRAGALLGDEGPGAGASWSPDGRLVAFIGPAVSGGPPGTHAVEVAGAPDWRPRMIGVLHGTPDAGGQLNGPPGLLWSPDGRAVYWVDLAGGHVVEAATARVFELPDALRGCNELSWQPMR